MVFPWLGLTCVCLTLFQRLFLCWSYSFTTLFLDPTWQRFRQATLRWWVHVRRPNGFLSIDWPLGESLNQLLQSRHLSTIFYSHTEFNPICCNIGPVSLLWITFKMCRLSTRLTVTMMSSIVACSQKMFSEICLSALLWLFRHKEAALNCMTNGKHIEII